MSLYQTFRNQYIDLKAERIERIIKGIESYGRGRFEVFPNNVIFVDIDRLTTERHSYHIYPLGYSDMPYMRFGFDGESATCEEVGEYLLNKYYGKCKCEDEMIEDKWTIDSSLSSLATWTKEVKLDSSLAKWLDDKEKLNMKNNLNMYIKHDVWSLFVLKFKHIIDKVIFNPPATIIMWRSGEKTVVKCGDDETFDPEKGLAMAIMKYEMGNKGNYYNQIRDILEEQSEYHMTEWLSEHDKAFNNPIVREHFW